MKNKLLEKFFRTAEVDSETPSAAALANFQMSMDKNPEAFKEIHSVIDEEIFSLQPERGSEVAKEKAEIEAADGAQVIHLMRRGIDHLNQELLIERAMLFENEIVPQIVKMLKTSLNDEFIETAVRVLAKSKKDIAEELIKNYGEMRNPYAQSLTLALLGFKAGEKDIEWFIEKYDELKRLYPDETYCEGAYYALCEIENRFYPRKKR